MVFQIILYKKIRSLVIISVLLALFFVSLVVFANILIQKPHVQQYIIHKISNFTKYDLTTGEIEINLWGGLGLLIHDLEAR